MTIATLANDGPRQAPSAGRIGALAAVTPIVMFGAWFGIAGWVGSAGGLALFVGEMALGAAAAGWIIGRRLGRSLSDAIMGFLVFGLVAWLVVLPLNVAAGSVMDLQSGKVADAIGLLAAPAGYLLYGLVVGIYASVFLLPFGLGWVVTFFILRWVFER